jgi:hypothetical protein
MQATTESAALLLTKALLRAGASASRESNPPARNARIERRTNRRFDLNGERSHDPDKHEGR